jgi:hypothetical protein
LVYDARVRPRFATLLIVAALLFGVNGWTQDRTGFAKTNKTDNSKSEPKYDETFSGSIVEVSATKITVSRSILGKPPERRSFWIKSDTRVEGKLRMRVRVTVGFVTTDDGDDVARLVVVRTSQKQSRKK